MNFANCSDEYSPEFVEQAVYDDGDWFCGDTLSIYTNSSEDHGRERHCYMKVFVIKNPFYGVQILLFSTILSFFV